MISTRSNVLYCLSKIEDTTEKDNMKMRNYMKKNQKNAETNIPSEAKAVGLIGDFIIRNRRLLVSIIVILAVLPLAVALIPQKGIDNAYISDESAIHLASAPMAATSSKKGVITIPAGTVKANPFLPYRDISGTSAVGDVPAFNLVEPPEVINENSDAARVMDTIVSGILYDKYSPSAILNIEGNDYLVKKGDVVNNYKIVNIMQDSVTVKLGANVYKAGIGEILTEGTLNHNNVSNLNNKFGGERQ